MLSSKVFNLLISKKNSFDLYIRMKFKFSNIFSYILDCNSIISERLSLNFSLDIMYLTSL